jgi:predicted nucleic acid-binding protein
VALAQPPSAQFTVIDTMIASAVLVGGRRPREADLLRRCDPYIVGRSLVLSFASVAELRYGALKAGWHSARLGKMEAWLRSISVVMPDDDLVSTCARLRHDCCLRGHGLGDKEHDSDRWIASTALRYDVPLVSTDNIFTGIPGLQLYQP